MEINRDNIIIPAEYVKVAHLFASKDASRWNLCGMQIREEHRFLTIAAMDPYSLAVIETGIKAPVGFEQVTLNPHGLVKLKTRKPDPFYAIAPVDSDTVRVSADLMEWEDMETVPGRYPDFRHVLPFKEEEFETASAVLDCTIMEKIGKAFKLFGAKGVACRLSEGKAVFSAWNRNDARMRVLAMPMREA